jgi:lon-related putative ATP-dependent protease
MPSAAPPSPLPPERLFKYCDPEQFDFTDTRALPEPDQAFGQARAMQALDLALDIRSRGYNVFVLGRAGSGRHATIRRLLESHAARQPAPPDWCYVDNFKQPNKPRALSLPAGQGQRLRAAMQAFVGELGQAITAALESDEYRLRVEAIQKDLKTREEALLRALGDEAGQQHIVLLRAPQGFAFAPMQDGQPMGSEAFEALPEEERKRFATAIEELGEKLRALLGELPRLRREGQARLRTATREAIALAAGHLVDELKEQFTAQPAVLAFLDDVRADVVESGGALRDMPRDMPREAVREGEEEEVGAMTGTVSLRRYEVNLLEPHDSAGRAPVVFAENPTYPNLAGRVDHLARMGALLTDFTLIRAGDLHRANGGYLMIDAARLVLQPYAWEALKRTLKSGKIAIESLPQLLGWINTVPLEPEPIPIDVKVVLFGEREDYYLLQALDPEFDALFEIAADFEDHVVRDAPQTLQLARLLGSMARRNALRPLERDAVARVVEQAARLAEDSGKLTTRMRWLSELLHEADTLAARAARAAVSREDVVAAIAAREHRADRLRERVREAMLEDTLLVATTGAEVGQVNALAVAELGEFRFAHPMRITATVRLGDGHVIDIEREATLGGPIHSKGVMILAAYLGARYAQAMPLSLGASLVFEQSYQTVEGDSASLAELCALLSALAQLPLAQHFAVTGSINQLGRVQAVGGVNEKIEGFFDICHARGLTGAQGVLVPEANVRHLMLREDVVAAARQGRFHVHAVSTVDEAMSLLTGVEAGVADAHGRLPEGSVNQLVARRLKHLSQLRRSFEVGEARPWPHAARRRGRVRTPSSERSV